MPIPMVEVNLPRFGSAVIRESSVDEVVCHRTPKGGQVEQYLVKWRCSWSQNRIPYSWHPVHELAGADGLGGSSADSALQHLQKYIENLRRKKTVPVTNDTSRKRKQGADAHAYRLSPSERVDGESSRASSLFSARSDDTSSTEAEEPDTYNCSLEVYHGYIVVRPASESSTDSRTLPTSSMLERARSSPTKVADAKIRAEFMRELQRIRGAKPVKLVNTRDASTPLLSFQFIDDYIYREGVTPPDPEAMEGCGSSTFKGQTCRPDMGGHCGCEYTKTCECLEYAEVREERLDVEEAAVWAIAKKNCGSSMGLPKKFPYSKETKLLASSYIISGYPIYECNDNCKCGPICKSRVVQHGRQVGLEIFKTKDRGWGLRCNERLRRGEFIDTYRGEVITDAEAEIRGNIGDKDKESYLFSLDTFAAENEMEPYVVDGQYFGGPSRFINHSCDPNCAIYAVCYDKNNTMIYELAFFAVREIPPGEELVFDYKSGVKDDDEVNVEDNSIPCRCGSLNCRKWLWK